MRPPSHNSIDKKLRIAVDRALPTLHHGICMNETQHPTIVFDAKCVLCSAHARFVLRYDRGGHFRLASMQGEVGAALYQRFGIDPATPDTLIVVQGDKALRDSEAILAIWSALGWPWRALALLHFVPKGLRDWLYRWIARNRYRLFGLRDTCWVPDAAQAGRVL